MKLFLIYNNKNFDLPSIQVNKIIKLVILDCKMSYLCTSI